jgi:hypothetical protein
MRLVFIYGPPAVGKLTVATELGRLTSFAVWDNHQSIDCLLPIFPFGTRSLNELAGKIRLLVLEEAAREEVCVIFTFVFAYPDDVEYVERVFSAVERHGAAVCLVQLTCTTDAQEARVLSADRTRRQKTRDVELVREWNVKHDLMTPIPGRSSLTIDNTDKAPAHVALAIAEHYALINPQSKNK